MPFYEYNHIKMNYTRSGKGKTIVLLHGWGASLATFEALSQDLRPHYDVITLDFPGFGQSTEPPTPWALSEYTALIDAFLTDQRIEAPIVVGHSFGGRVAIQLSQKRPLTQLILINSAGIKPKRKKNYYFKIYSYKLLKNAARLPLLSWILEEPLRAYRECHASGDYKQATDTMKQVLSKVVNEDLTPLLPKIQCPTLLIWGDQDDSTPIADARTMAQLIPDAGLVVFEGAGHFSYLEEPIRTALVIKTFIGGKS